MVAFKFITSRMRATDASLLGKDGPSHLPSCELTEVENMKHAEDGKSGVFYIQGFRNQQSKLRLTVLRGGSSQISLMGQNAVFFKYHICESFK